MCRRGSNHDDDDGDDDDDDDDDRKSPFCQCGCHWMGTGEGASGVVT